MPACKDRAGLMRVQTWYEWVKRTHANTVRQRSGCWPKCEVVLRTYRTFLLNKFILT